MQVSTFKLRQARRRRGHERIHHAQKAELEKIRVGRHNLGHSVFSENDRRGNVVKEVPRGMRQLLDRLVEKLPVSRGWLKDDQCVGSQKSIDEADRFRCGERLLKHSRMGRNPREFVEDRPRNAPRRPPRRWVSKNCLARPCAGDTRFAAYNPEISLYC